MGFENVAQFREDRAQRLSRVLAEMNGFGLREQLLKLKRRRVVILATMAIITTMTAFLVDGIQPLYRARAYVMIDTNRQNTLSQVDAVVTALPPDLETIQSEIEVIRSRGLAEKVVRQLGLDALPEFNEALKQNESGVVSSAVSWLYDTVKSGIDAVNFVMGQSQPETIEVSEETQRQDQWTKIINNVLDRLEAAPEGHSRVVAVSFTSNDRELAAKVANTFSDLYIMEQLEAKFEAAERATTWLNERLVALRDRTDVSERAVEQFRKQAGLIQGDGATLASQEISQLNTELVTVRAVRAEAEARLRQAERAVANPDGEGVSFEVLNSELIQALKQQQVELQRQYAQMNENYGERHPTMINLRAEIADLNGRVRSEVSKIVSGIRNEVQVARVREGTLQAELNTLKQRAGEMGQSEVQLRSLEAEAQANRMLLNTLMARFNETDIQRDMQQPDARVISHAPVPQEASFPNKRMFVGFALFLSAVLGVVIAFIIEHLDQGFRSTEQLSQMTDLPALGMVPAIPGWPNKVKVEDYFLDKPRSNFSESISSALASLFLVSADRRPRTVMVTSSLPGEGKSLAALSIARAAAQSGLKTLLIDCDLRRPVLGNALGFKRQPGLVEFLMDKVPLDTIIRKDSKAEVDFIPAGGPVANPVHFLAAERTRAFIQGMAKNYDFVVIDTPPVMVVSDARLLCRYADQTMFVVRWARTRREHVLTSIKQLLEAGGSVGGVLLSRVNIRRHAEYGFGDSGQYRLGSKYYET